MENEGLRLYRTLNGFRQKYQILRERERERRSFLTCDVAKSFRIGPKERERERYDQQAFAQGESQ